MANETTSLGVGVDSTAVRTATAELERLIQVGTRAEQVLNQLGGNSKLQSFAATLSQFISLMTSAGTATAGQTAKLNTFNVTVSETTNNITRLNQATERSSLFGGRGMGGGYNGIYGAIIGLYAIKSVVTDMIQAADSVQLLEARLKNATKSTEDFNYAFSAVKDIADKVHQPLDAIGTLYARISRSADNMGASQQQIRTITLATADALRISGANTEETTAAMIQLSQAFNKGKLDGDEFRSQMENNPRLMKAVADGMDVPIGKLKEYSKQGKLTMDVVAQAIIDQSDTLRAESEKMGTTVAQAFTDVKNSFTEMIGESNHATGATAELVRSIEGFATYLKSDDFKTSLTVAIQLVGTLGSALFGAAEKIQSLAQWAAYKSSGEIDPSLSNKNFNTQYYTSSDKATTLRAELAEDDKYKDSNTDWFGMAMSPERRAAKEKDLADTVAAMKRAIAARTILTRDAQQQSLEAGASDFLDGIIPGNKLKSTYTSPTKKHHKAISDRTARLASQFETDSYDTDDTPLNKYRDAILKITEAREADIKSGRGVAEVQANVNRAVTGALAIYERQEDQLKNKNTAAIKAYGDALDKSNAALQAQFDNQVAKVGMGDREYEIQTKINKAYLDEAEAQKKLAIQLQKGEKNGGISDSTYAIELAKLQESTDEKVRIINDGYARMADANSNWLLGFQRGLSNWATDAGNAADQAASATTKAFDSMTDSMTNFLTTGKGGFKSMVTSILTDLTRMEVRVLASKILTSIIGMFLGSNDGTYFDSSGTATGLGNNGYGYGGGNTGGFGMMAQNAKGNVYATHSLSRLSGTVVEKPTLFASGGAVAGEAGPEGIFPLDRKADGKLGLKVSGAGAGNTILIETNVTVMSDGSTKSETKTSGNDVDQTFRQMADMINTRIKEEVQSMLLPGGLIWNDNHGRR